MKKLFHFILVLTLINISTQFIFDSETDELFSDQDPDPTPNPVVKRCGAKLVNNTETKNCLVKVKEYWYPNTTSQTTEVNKTIYTQCCYTWDNLKCYLNIYEKVCTQEEVNEANAYLKVALNFVEREECERWPFKDNQKLCHSK
jgi:hypothetical protein